jgi:hypothetical protein
MTDDEPTRVIPETALYPVIVQFLRTDAQLAAWQAMRQHVPRGRWDDAICGAIAEATMNAVLERLSNG